MACPHYSNKVDENSNKLFPETATKSPFPATLLPFRATTVAENGNKVLPFRATLLPFPATLLLVWSGLNASVYSNDCKPSRSQRFVDNIQL